VDATLQAAQARREKESALMESLRQGRTTMELLNLEAILNGLTQDRRRAP
jgi:regulator of RNase E activity RraA